MPKRASESKGPSKAPASLISNPTKKRKLVASQTPTSTFTKPSAKSQPATKTKVAKAKPVKLPSPELSQDDEDIASESASEEGIPGNVKGADPAEESLESEEENTHLKGFSSGSEDDSEGEDDDLAEGDESTFDLKALPTVAKDDATVKRKLAKAKQRPGSEKGVMYIGRIPHGFFEDEMRQYFTQFGEVTRLRISRNKKTGKSKHYGFLEFASLPVAEIVCETMNNYLLMGHILQCHMIPNDKVHPELWVGANRKYRPVPTARVARQAHNKERTDEEESKRQSRLRRRQNTRQKKLKALGIDYELPQQAIKV